MRKIMTIALVILSLSYWSIAKANTDAIVDLTIEQLKKSSELGDITSCLGTSESNFLNVYRKTLRYCINKHSASEKAMNTCLQKQLETNLNISSSTLTKCNSQFSEGDEDMDEGENGYDEEDEYKNDYSGLSDKELKAKIRADAKESLGSIVAMNKARSQGTEDLVTLPIFTPSEMVAHYKDGMDIGGKLTLPIATIVTSANINKVISFYKKALPKFKVDNFNDEIFTFT